MPALKIERIFAASNDSAKMLYKRLLASGRYLGNAARKERKADQIYRVYELKEKEKIIRIIAPP